MTEPLALFGTCPARGCETIVGPSEVCDPCLALLAEDRDRHRAHVLDVAWKAAGRRRVVRRAGPDGQPEPLLSGWLPASESPAWIAGGASFRREPEHIAAVAGLAVLPAGWRQGQCGTCGDRHSALCPDPDYPDQLMCMCCYSRRPGMEEIQDDYVRSGEALRDIEAWRRPSGRAGQKPAGAR
ncbi:MAG: hypothetical protein ACRDRJ_12725 [Streptosporangiaceae bacterium]